MKQQPYQTEFPDYELDFVIPEGFTDSSWRNNAMPSFQSEADQLEIYADYEDATMRESGMYGDARFTLYDTLNDFYPIASTDSYYELIRLIALCRWVRKNGGDIKQIVGG